MLRHLLTCCVALVAASGASQAGDHFYFPRHVFAGPPVVYAAPVVSYQPAYVVPTGFVSVQSFPVTTMAYSTQYFAPVVPVAHTAYYAPQTVVAPAYVAPGYFGRHGRYRSFRGVEVEFERDGDIEIDYKYR